MLPNEQRQPLPNGQTAVWSTNQAPGAMENGARVKKAVYEPRDRHPVGARGTVVGSLATPDGSQIKLGPGIPAITFIYFVMWDDDGLMSIPIAINDYKIEEADGEE